MPVSEVAVLPRPVAAEVVQQQASAEVEPERLALVAAAAVVAAEQRLEQEPAVEAMADAQVLAVSTRKLYRLVPFPLNPAQFRISDAPAAASAFP